MNVAAVILAALTPLERMAALKPGSSQTPVWMNWTVWLPMVLAVVVASALISAYRYWVERHRALQEFGVAAERLGLGVDERAVLARVAAAAGFKSVDTVLASDIAFDRGAKNFMASGPTQALSEPALARLVAITQSLREKLGFSEKPEIRPARRRGNVPIPAGSNVALLVPDAAMPVLAAVAQADENEIVVHPVRPVEGRPGDTWRLRYVAKGAQWEFDAIVKKALPKAVTLKVSGEPRSVNHRRFVRAATQKPAHLAPFPFMAQSAEGELLEFVAGTLTEIGGPGVRIQSPVHTKPGDRVLVVLSIAGGRMIRGLGTVRRCSQQRDRVWETVVEMTGLSEDDLGKLVQETNQAAKQLPADVSEPSGPEPSKDLT